MHVGLLLLLCCCCWACINDEYRFHDRDTVRSLIASFVRRHAKFCFDYKSKSPRTATRKTITGTVGESIINFFWGTVHSLHTPSTVLSSCSWLCCLFLLIPFQEPTDGQQTDSPKYVRVFDECPLAEGDGGGATGQTCSTRVYGFHGSMVSLFAQVYSWCLVSLFIYLFLPVS
jgi:hypothetical protein